MSTPNENDVLAMINDPNISPWRTENDQLMATEQGDFIVFSVGGIKVWKVLRRRNNARQAFRWS